MLKSGRSRRRGRVRFFTHLSIVRQRWRTLFLYLSSGMTWLANRKILRKEGHPTRRTLKIVKKFRIWYRPKILLMNIVAFFLGSGIVSQRRKNRLVNRMRPKKRVLVVVILTLVLVRLFFTRLRNIRIRRKFVRKRFGVIKRLFGHMMRIVGFLVLLVVRRLRMSDLVFVTLQR